MKTEYEYIEFVPWEQDPKKKTSTWSCVNIHHGGDLGIVKWYGPWRRYCYFAPAYQTIYSPGCLADIQQFLADLMEERKTHGHDIG